MKLTSVHSQIRCRCSQINVAFNKLMTFFTNLCLTRIQFYRSQINVAQRGK